MRLCPAKIKHCINTDKAQEALIAITRDAVPCVRSTGTQRPAVEHNGALATQSKAAWGEPEREKEINAHVCACKRGPWVMRVFFSSSCCYLTKRKLGVYKCRVGNSKGEKKEKKRETSIKASSEKSFFFHF